MSLDKKMPRIYNLAHNFVPVITCVLALVWFVTIRASDTDKDDAASNTLQSYHPADLLLKVAIDHWKTEDRLFTKGLRNLPQNHTNVSRNIRDHQSQHKVMIQRIREIVAEIKRQKIQVARSRDVLITPFARIDKTIDKQHELMHVYLGDLIKMCKNKVPLID